MLATRGGVLGMVEGYNFSFASHLETNDPEIRTGWSRRPSVALNLKPTQSSSFWNENYIFLSGR